MILRFPNLEAVQLAMTSGLIPKDVWIAAAQAALDEDNVVIKSDGKLTRTQLAELKQVGVESLRESPVALNLNVCCWLQILPLNQCKPSEIKELSDTTTVLFHLPGQNSNGQNSNGQNSNGQNGAVSNSSLHEVVGEILRLGNDRQSFRMLGSNGKQKYLNHPADAVIAQDESSSLLRVIGPPYYSMLRALEAGASANGVANGNPNAKSTTATNNGSAGSRITAFVETHPRVWVQYGYQHPLGAKVTPPPGKWLLLKPDASWMFIEEAPFRDIYESIEFGLPNLETGWNDQPLSKKFDVTLNLTRGSTGEMAELWVIRKNALAQMEKLVLESDDRLLARLAFAVAETKGEEPVVIVRVRPSKKQPPVLVLDGLAYRCYLKIPNLFLPVAMRLHPPLRRDAVTKLLASNQQDIVWLEPDEESESTGQLNQAFAPNSVRDAAFRPVTDWVKYVLDHEQKSLSAWVESYQFDFESFVCSDDKKEKPKPKPKKDLKPIGERTDGKKSKSSTGKSAKKKSADAVAEEQVDFEIADFSVQQTEPTQLQVQLSAVETRFLESEDPLDAPDRRLMWSEMGVLNARLQHRQDTTLCWSNSVWNASLSDDLDVAKSFAQWLKCEVVCSQFNTFGIDELDLLLNESSMRPLDSSLVAAYFVWAAAQDTMPDGLGERLNQATQFMERQESSLPIRTVWLTWVALYKLSGHDTLLLARARDRVLQRLFDQGLAAEYDMPNFMRVRGLGESDRFRVLREQVIDLHELISQWVIEPVSGAAEPRTKEYAHLMFAFALAKLGEVAESKRIMADAIGNLVARDPIHYWLGSAFEFRITQALTGQSNQSQLSENLLERLEAMERMSRYKVDRFRGQSRMIEPHERINAFTRWHRRHPDELSKRLSELTDISDREQLQSTLTDVLSDTKTDTKTYGRVLVSAMELAPRLGEDLANHLFDEVVGWLQKKNGSTMERANLLQKSMYVAAHFGRIDVVQTFVGLFEQSLPKIVSEYLSLQSNHAPINKEQVDAIEALFTESFRGLRKLGMREEIGRLYSGVADLVEKHEPKGKKARQAKNSKTDIDVTRPLRLLLCVASGWYYFGQVEKAAEIVGKVREILLTQELPPIEQRDLACAYINCISHAPVEAAIGMISELYQVKGKKRSLANIKDSMTTSSHFSISQLDLVETTILALVSDEFSLNEESRRWLDEDEFLVRRRIHDDVRNAVE